MEGMFNVYYLKSQRGRKPLCYQLWADNEDVAVREARYWLPSGIQILAALPATRRRSEWAKT